MAVTEQVLSLYRFVCFLLTSRSHPSSSAKFVGCFLSLAVWAFCKQRKPLSFVVDEKYCQRDTESTKRSAGRYCSSYSFDASLESKNGVYSSCLGLF